MVFLDTAVRAFAKVYHQKPLIAYSLTVSTKPGIVFPGPIDIVYNSGKWNFSYTADYNILVL